MGSQIILASLLFLAQSCCRTGSQQMRHIDSCSCILPALLLPHHHSSIHTEVDPV